MTTHSRKEQFLKEENIKLIDAQVAELCEFYTKKYKFVIIKGKYVKSALTKTINHYKRHLKEFDCKITSVDFYKVYSWFGYFLAEELQSKDMRYGALDVTLWRLHRELQNSGKYINDDKILKEIFKLVQNEIEGNADFGIGKNGLYILMKSASIMETQSLRKDA